MAKNHPTPDLATPLAAAVPESAEVYIGNVSGVLLAALIAVCSLIAWYNLAEAPPRPDQTLALMRALLHKHLRVEGVVITDWLHREAEFRRDMYGWGTRGQITYLEDEYLEDEINGLENAPEAFIGMLRTKLREARGACRTLDFCEMPLWHSPSLAALIRRSSF
ncbi:hypothetical protein [Xanthocytophaga agilis]|uniref:Uncharacterized protein n=1 Tax=Xanthocytophaga agilis TaxID=3048010 RepID=A0AAE3RAG1_9BACT|nr:hypothetical protein [Xanthocytophaga agilis]MDJ1506631.1 hypothetical protein [Xanthocytophaga agilis]